MIKDINTLFVTMFGLGRISKIPGTFGSLATIILLYFFFHILDFSSILIFIVLIIIFVFSFKAVADYIKNNENKDPKIDFGVFLNLISSIEINFLSLDSFLILNSNSTI